MVVKGHWFSGKGNVDGFVKSIFRPPMAKYPKGTIFSSLEAFPGPPDASFKTHFLYGIPAFQAGTRLFRDAYSFSCHSRTSPFPCHSRECGNLDVGQCQVWMPACAGTTRHDPCALFPCHYRVMALPVRRNDTETDNRPFYAFVNVELVYYSPEGKLRRGRMADTAP